MHLKKAFKGTYKKGGTKPAKEIQTSVTSVPNNKKESFFCNEGDKDPFVPGGKATNGGQDWNGIEQFTKYSQFTRKLLKNYYIL